jgi:hypothetical protein
MSVKDVTQHADLLPEHCGRFARPKTRTVSVATADGHVKEFTIVFRPFVISALGTP